jgi:uncharacterized protein (TIGR02453 family)
VTTVFPGFSQEMPRFFRALKRNNRREWFQPRKPHFEQHVKGPMIELVTAINSQLMKFAPDYVTDPKKAIFRIYRDTRFSPDKTPYKTHIGASFSRRGLSLPGGGLYFGISEEGVEVAGGVYHPQPDTLLAVRTHISKNHMQLRAILAHSKVRKFFGGLEGGELSRVPKGFEATHPAADLIKKKDWLLDVSLPPSVATTPALYKELLERFRAMVPFLEFLNQPLAGKRHPKDLLEAHF